MFERANEDASASGMGTTMTVAIVDDGSVTIGHVGDSRAYRLRHGDLEQLTDDHSLVAELVRSGRLTPEEADAHPQRSVITRAVGTDPDVDVDAFTVAAEAGDVYLLCSDGLTDMLDDGGIRTVFEEHPDDLRAAAKGLVTAANRVGGDDNITVVCFAMDEDVPEGATAAMKRSKARRRRTRSTTRSTGSTRRLRRRSSRSRSPTVACSLRHCSAPP